MREVYKSIDIRDNKIKPTIRMKRKTRRLLKMSENILDFM
jgi:hypothetical protein